MAWDEEEDDNTGGVVGTLLYGAPEDDEDQPGMSPRTPGTVPSGSAGVSAAPRTAVAPSPTDDNEPRPPVYSPSPLAPPPTPQLAQERQYEQQLTAAPPNRADYKPSIGRRIGSSIAGALVGFGTRNAGEGMNVGLSAEDAPFNRAQQDYQQKTEAAQRGLGAMRTGQEMQERDWENQLQAHQAGLQDYNASDRAYNAGTLARDRDAQAKQRLQSVAPGTEQPDDPNNPMGSWHATTVGGQPIRLNTPPDSWKNSTEGKDAYEHARREKLVTDNQLTGDDAKYVRVNGKLKEPAATTTIKNEPAGKEELDLYLATLGHPPTTDDLLKWKHGTKSGGEGMPMSANLKARIESIKDTAFTAARKSFGNGQSAEYTFDDYVNDMQDAQNNFEDKIESITGNDIPHVNVRDYVDPKTGQWKSSPPSGPTAPGAPKPAAGTQAAADIPIPQPIASPRPSQQPPAAAGPPAGSTIRLKNGKEAKVGDPVIVGGQTYYVTGYNPATGKPKVDTQRPAPPAAQPQTGAQ